MGPFPLHSISRKKVYLHNIIFGRQRAVGFSIDSKNYHFSFAFSTANYQPKVFFKVKFSDHWMWMSLDELPPLAYFSDKFSGMDLDALPQEMQSIILESAFEKVLNVIEEELGIVLSIEEYTHTPPAERLENKLPFVIRVDGVTERIQGCLYMGDSALEFLAAILESVSFARKNRFTDIDIPLHAIIGKETLSFGEFNELRLRDIILLSDESFSKNGACKVIIGNHLVYGGILKNNKLTLESVMEERLNNDGLLEDSSLEGDQEELLDEDLPAEEEEIEETVASDFEGESDFEDEVSSGALPRELDDVQINLTFEVGQKRISLKDLQTLKSGFTFELENSVERPIIIRANGRVIGAGELLKIDDRVGVRVTSFSKK